MDNTALLLARSSELYARDPTPKENRPPVYKAIGISLAIASGLFIGTSFVLKKMGLLKANVKYNEEAGEGYGYLKNAYWWTGMTLMIIGEICNFVAYAFVDAILVTPLGALSIGCFQCIIGSVVIVMNAPSQSSAANIQEMRHYVAAPGFLVDAALVIIGCAFVAFWVGPRYGKKSMLVYLTICSLIGGLSVVSTQGLGAAIVAQASGTPQFNQWFLYVLFVFVITTLVTEIIFLNKALNLFNAALVTPTYYVYFTSATIVTSAILFQGFKGTPTSIITVVLGFFVICSGVVLLQLSKSAKDVPDAAVFKGDLDQVRTVAEQEEPESEPKADAIRGAAAIVRRISQARQKTELAEARRVHEEKMKDQMEPIGENEQVEWDGLRRRKTTINGAAPGSLRRQKTIHPPLGMAHFPDDDPSGMPAARAQHPQIFMEAPTPVSSRASVASPPASTTLKVSAVDLPPEKPQRACQTAPSPPSPRSPKSDDDDPTSPTTAPPPHRRRHGNESRPRPAPRPHPFRPQQTNHVGLRRRRPPRSSAPAAPLPPTTNQSTKRQFSFQNVFHRNQSPLSPPLPPTRPCPQRHVPTPKTSHPPSTSSGSNNGNTRPSTSRLNLGLGLRSTSSKDKVHRLKPATEEERLGLVKGDSHHHHSVTSPTHAADDYSDRGEDDWELEGRPTVPVDAVGSARQAEVVPLDAGPAPGLGYARIERGSSRTPLMSDVNNDDDDDEDEEPDARERRRPAAPVVPRKDTPRANPDDGSGGGTGDGGTGFHPAFL
ncbi:hypothetical protein ABVK25_012471 [Lepraria finkii]|uniref:DUF803-domain-containing protein n=1 Tax=Lepraria finkii TaxID=1340010 RepID=A0ABR4AF67_9LECA